MVIYVLFWLDSAARNGFKRHKLDWEDEIVVITGGSGSVGLLLADTLAMRGVTVVVLDINKPQSQFDVEWYECDVTDEKAVKKAAEEIRKDWGNPTVLINNAGIVNGKSILDLDSADIRKCIDVNLISHYWTIRAFLPDMLEKNHGHIVSVSSAMAWTGVANLSDYCATKAAVQSLHESLRFEIERSKGPLVRSTIISPGLIQSPMFKGIRYGGIAPFVAPVIEPIAVAKKIIAALDVYESQDICIPTYSSLSGLGRFVPFSLVQLTHWLFQADDAMVPMTAKKE